MPKALRRSLAALALAMIPSLLTAREAPQPLSGLGDREPDEARLRLTPEQVASAGIPGIAGELDRCGQHHSCCASCQDELNSASDDCLLAPNCRLSGW